MSEKQTHSPEASSQALDDLYRQSADCLETWLEYGQAEVSTSPNPHLLAVKIKMPELNGKSLEIDYERPSLPEDPTQADRTYPLKWDDNSGKNMWNTWIGIKVFDTAGSLIHDIDISHSGNSIDGEPLPAHAFDKKFYPGQDPDGDPVPVSMLDAQSLNAHMERAAENFLEAHQTD